MISDLVSNSLSCWGLGTTEAGGGLPAGGTLGNCRLFGEGRGGQACALISLPCQCEHGAEHRHANRMNRWDADCLEVIQAGASNVCSPQEAFVEADVPGKWLNSSV